MVGWMDGRTNGYMLESVWTLGARLAFGKAYILFYTT